MKNKGAHFESRRRHILMVAAMRRDMGIADQLNFAYADNATGDSKVSNGTYVLVPRHAPNSALTVQDSTAPNNAKITISSNTGGNNQKFLLDFQEDGTYRIRTALTGNRALDLPGANNGTTANNSTQLQVFDNNNGYNQRWFLIPAGNGFYKIAPRNDNFKAIDVPALGTADGTPVDIYDDYDQFNEQWQLVPAGVAAATSTAPTSATKSGAAS